MRTKKTMDYRFPHYTEDDLRALDREALESAVTFSLTMQPVL